MVQVVRIPILDKLIASRHLNKHGPCGARQSTFLIIYKSARVLSQQLALNNHQKQNQQRPICRDYTAGNCRRDSCRYIHLDNREFSPLLVGAQSLTKLEGMH